MEKTSYIGSIIDRNNFVDTNATYAKMVAILNAVLKFGGNTSTLAALNALTNPMKNLVIELTTAGTLTKGTLPVVVGDTVIYDGSVWEKISLGNKLVGETLTDNKTLTASDSEKVLMIGTDAKVITLPTTALGLKYTIINIGAAGNNIVTISPAAADGISGTITLAATVVVDAGVVNKDLINTKASSQAGDTVTLFGTGVTGTKAWIILSSTGIWAAEA